MLAGKQLTATEVMVEGVVPVLLPPPAHPTMDVNRIIAPAKVT
jgi:hypothetical protein